MLYAELRALASGGVAKSLQVYYNNIKVMVDGSPANLGKDSTGKANEAFIYNGTTYLPIRAVSEALGEDVSWDGKTSTVYVGEKPGEVNYLMKYAYADEYTGIYDGTDSDSFSMGGIKYTKGYTMGWSSRMYFNLNGQFDELTFEYGSYKKDTITGAAFDFDIVLDDKVVDTLTVESGQLPKEYTVSVKGVNQLKFVPQKGFNDGKFGIGNPILK